MFADVIFNCSITETESNSTVLKWLPKWSTSDENNRILIFWKEIALTAEKKTFFFFNFSRSINLSLLGGATQYLTQLELDREVNTFPYSNEILRASKAYIMRNIENIKLPRFNRYLILHRI